VPGRIGGAVLRCGGTFDLARVDWIQAARDQNKTFYFVRYDHVDEMTSVFGPGPAVVGALAMLDVGEGDSISDASLRSRERIAGAALVAIAAVLMLIAGLAGSRTHADGGAAAADAQDEAMRRRAALGPNLMLAAITAMLCVLSFAGVATLGQGPWQATTPLPFPLGAVAVPGWPEARPRPPFVVPALLLVAVMLRPTIAPLALGIGLTWARDTRVKKDWLVATAIALVVASPLIVWNAIHLYSPLPIGQWQANKHQTENVFSLAHAATGIAGLLVSPGRGLLWFAPIAIVGVVMGFRERRWRFLAGGVVLQVIALALFFKWHGGQAFGPRLLAEATGVAIFLVVAAPIGRARIVALVAAVLTVVVGQLGLWSWRPEQWESRRLPESHPTAFWDVVDSPLASTIVDTPTMPHAHDSPPTNGLTCEHGHLRSY